MTAVGTPATLTISGAVVDDGHGRGPPTRCGWSCCCDEVRATGPSHMSMLPGSSGSKVRGLQAASSSIRRTPKEYS